MLFKIRVVRVRVILDITEVMRPSMCSAIIINMHRTIGKLPPLNNKQFGTVQFGAIKLISIQAIFNELYLQNQNRKVQSHAKFFSEGNDSDDLIVQAFKAYDCDGKIDSKMFEHALKTWGDKMTKAEIDDIFGEFEIDEDFMIKSKDVIGLFVAQKEAEKKEEEAAPAPAAAVEAAPAEQAAPEEEGDAKKKKKKKKKAAK